MMPEQDPDPIIVFGAPRSGTTYLQEILDRHPAVFVSHEMRLFAWLHQAVAVLTQNDQFLVTYREQFVTHLRQTLPALIREFYRTLKPSARYWGDKNPHYLDSNNRGCLETAVALFPGARFIHIIRDGRDVVSSLLRRKHADGTPWVDFTSAHWTWTSHVEIGCAFGATQAAERYFELRYEDLIADDLAMAERMFAFLGVEMHDAVAEFCRAQQEKRTPFSYPTRDLSGTAAVSDWKRILNPEEQNRSLELLRPHLVRLGYLAAETPEPTAPSR